MMNSTKKKKKKKKRRNSSDILVVLLLYWDEVAKSRSVVLSHISLAIPLLSSIFFRKVAVHPLESLEKSYPFPFS